MRACNQNPDGTSNLLIQGIARVECDAIVQEEPYRIVSIKALASTAGATDDANLKLRRRVERLITLKRKLGGGIPDGFTQFLKTVDDSETFVDLAAFTLCEHSELKQKLLETLDVHERLLLYSRALRSEVDSLTLHRKLQGNLSDDDIANN